MPEAFTETFVAVIISQKEAIAEASMGFIFESFRERKILFMFSTLLFTSTKASVKTSVEENLLSRNLL